MRQRVFVHNDKRYLYRSKGEAFKLKSSRATVKHGGGTIMLWGRMYIFEPVQMKDVCYRIILLWKKEQLQEINKTPKITIHINIRADDDCMKTSVHCTS